MKSIVKTKTKFELIFISTETSAKIFNYGMENPQLKFVELHTSHFTVFDFAAKTYKRKSQFNGNEKDFQPSFWLYFQSKGRLVLLMTFFESCNSMEMKRTFSHHFGFTFTLKGKTGSFNNVF